MAIKGPRQIRKKFLTASLFFLLLFQFSSCALFHPIFRLIYFVVQLPFRILFLVLQLIPYALRYAPLALLFVEGEHYDTYYAMLTEEAKIIRLEGDLYCFAIDPRKEKNAQLLADMAIFHKDRLFFLSDEAFDVSEDTAQGIYNSLVYNDFYLAYDSRLDLSGARGVLDQNA